MLTTLRHKIAKTVPIIKNFDFLALTQWKIYIMSIYHTCLMLYSHNILNIYSQNSSNSAVFVTFNFSVADFQCKRSFHFCQHPLIPHPMLLANFFRKEQRAKKPIRFDVWKICIFHENAWHTHTYSFPSHLLCGKITFHHSRVLNYFSFNYNVALKILAVSSHKCYPIFRCSLRPYHIKFNFNQLKV